MKIGFKYQKKNWIPFGILTVFVVLTQLAAGPNPILSVLTLALTFLFLTLHFEASEKAKAFIAAAELILGSVLTIFSVQYLILDPENFGRIKDQKMVMNIFLALILYILLFLISNRTAIAGTIAGVLLLAFGFVDYFVYQFRGNEIVYSDLKAAKTGLSVAGGYHFTLCSRAALVLYGQMLFLILLWKLNVRMKSRLKGSIIGTLSAVFCALYVGTHLDGINTETWEQKGTYKNGFYLNMLLSIRDSIVEAPDGYSLDAVAELEAQYADTTEDADMVKKPTIIVIMNESFSDLAVDGEVETNIPYLSFFNSLQLNTVKGYALSSVYGAKTPNSEWEFLTGNSMAFLPEGSVVYQQYISDQPFSLVSTLKDYDYTCVVMHPYYATGWSRDTVYPSMGFDEMYFIDDFPQEDIIREYISDQELYEQMIARYEDKDEDENLFLFGVTMQNHGGYVTTYDNFTEDVYKVGRSYTDANQYLSLIRRSDEALEYLVNYFSQVDDPVEIVFFGDHQPGLTEGFYEILNGKGLSGLTMEELENLYTVPFMVWTNYESDAQSVDITSLDLLSTYTMEQSGLPLTAYDRFLEDFREVIPAINSQGYYSLTDDCYKHLEDATGEEAEWIEKYEILQYNCMFDEDNRSQVFFPDTQGD